MAFKDIFEYLQSNAPWQLRWIPKCRGLRCPRDSFGDALVRYSSIQSCIIMSNMTYWSMKNSDQPLVWLHNEVKTPPFSTEARIEAGFLLRRLQKGESLELPHSRPMPSISNGCHELRINDKNKTWRIVYYIDEDAIVILEVFPKKSQKTPQKVIDVCKQRLARYKN